MPGVARGWGAFGRERRHHRSSDRDVRTRVEEIGRRSIEARRPRDRNRHEANARPATLLGHRACKVQHLIGRNEVVVGRQGDVVTQKEGVRVRDLLDERLDEPIVRVEAARENEGQKIHSGLATVRASSGTGPK